MATKLCLCGTGQPYAACCRPYHDGKASAPHAEALMRSRYSAYALHKASYIIQTTHPDNEQWQVDHKAWTRDLLSYCRSTEFIGLEVLDFQDGSSEAFVTFKARLRHRGVESILQERSRFLRVDGTWLYVSAEFLD